MGLMCSAEFEKFHQGLKCVMHVRSLEEDSGCCKPVADVIDLFVYYWVLGYM